MFPIIIPIINDMQSFSYLIIGDNLHAVGEMPVRGSSRKPARGGGAVAGVVASRSIATTGRPLCRVVVVRARATSNMALDRFAGGVVPGAWAGVWITAATAGLRRRVEGVRILFFSTTTVRSVCHHIVTRGLSRKRRFY